MPLHQAGQHVHGLTSRSAALQSQPNQVASQQSGAWTLQGCPKRRPANHNLVLVQPVFVTPASGLFAGQNPIGFPRLGQLQVLRADLFAGSERTGRRQAQMLAGMTRARIAAKQRAAVHSGPAESHQHVTSHDTSLLNGARVVERMKGAPAIVAKPPRQGT